MLNERGGGIIFDKDGTLLDFDALWIPVAEAALRRLARRFCVPRRAAEAAGRALGISEGSADRCGLLAAGTYAQIAQCVRNVFSEFDTETAEKEMLRGVCAAFAAEMPRGRILPAVHGLRGVLTDLRREGYTLFVATTDRAASTRECLRALGIADLFAEVFADGTGIPVKPDPAAIGKIADEYGIGPQDLFMTGDTLTDVLFAKNGNIRSIALARTEREREILSSCADAVVRDVSALPEVLKKMR